MTELKFLPTEWFDLVAQCLTLIEDDASLPDVCVLGMISTIPKGVDNNLDEHDSGSLAVGNGLDTRPITNLTPLYTAYSGTRFSQMSEWREKWPTSCMHGARKSHEIYDVSWSLGLHLEYETLCERFLAGISMDRRKFFDLLQYDVVGFFFLQAFGAPAGVLVAAKKNLQQLEVQIQVPESYHGESFHKKAWFCTRRQL